MKTDLFICDSCGKSVKETHREPSWISVTVLDGLPSNFHIEITREDISIGTTKYIKSRLDFCTPICAANYFQKLRDS